MLFRRALIRIRKFKVNIKEMDVMKKRIIKYVSFATVIDFALYALCNLLRINIPLFSQSVSASNVLGLLVSCITLALCFLLGYNLSKDKTSAVVFSGAMYFAGHLPNIVSVLVGIVISYFSLDGVSVLLTTIESFIGIVLLPLEIYIGVYAYTAFVGINDKQSPKGMTDFTMSLPRARKRYIVSTVIQILVASLITSIPVFVSLFVEDMNSVFSGFFVKICAWVSSVVIFFIIYFTGYKPGKNHTEAMAFYSAYALGGGIASVISALFSVVIAPVISKVLMNGIGDEFTQEVLNEMFSVIDVDTFSLAAASPVLLILSVIIGVYLLRFFFEREIQDSEFYAQ